GLKFVALGGGGQAESLEGLELQWLQRSPLRFPRAPRAPSKEIVRIGKVAAVAHASLRAVGPGVGAHAPRRPMAGEAVLLIGFHLGVAHAGKVVVGGIELAHVLEAEPQVLSLASPPHPAPIKPPLAPPFP